MVYRLLRQDSKTVFGAGQVFLRIKHDHRDMIARRMTPEDSTRYFVLGLWVAIFVWSTMAERMSLLQSD